MRESHFFFKKEKVDKKKIHPTPAPPRDGEGDGLRKQKEKFR